MEQISAVLIVLMGIISLSMGVNVGICPTRTVTVDSAELSVTSPGWPNMYPPNENCNLTIITSERKVIHVEFEDFVLEEDDDDPDRCDYDSLILTGGVKTKRLCGQLKPDDYESTANKLTLQFKSDSRFEEKGFKIKITTKASSRLPPADAKFICPVRTIRKRRSGAFISPNFPFSYRNNVLCNVTVHVPDNFMTTVWFESFKLEAAPSCAKDNLVIKDEIKDTGELCGDSLPAPMHFYGHDVTLTFKSDGTTTAKGFYVKYNMTRLRSGKCMCFNGLEYITVKKFHRKTFLVRDEIRFRFKTLQADGLIVYSKGTLPDYIYIALQGGTLFYEEHLGTGFKRAVLAGVKLNDNKWHKVVMKRQQKQISIDVDKGNYTVSDSTPGAFRKLNIPNSVGHVLGAPSGKGLVSNYIGCIKHFYIDGREVLSNALGGKPDYELYGKSRVKLC